jgi:hypothetical protein
MIENDEGLIALDDLLWARSRNIIVTSSSWETDSSEASIARREPAQAHGPARQAHGRRRPQQADPSRRVTISPALNRLSRRDPCSRIIIAN